MTEPVVSWVATLLQPFSGPLANLWVQLSNEVSGSLDKASEDQGSGLRDSGFWGSGV